MTSSPASTPPSAPAIPAADDLSLAAGDILFHEGEQGSDAYVILNGLMEISRRVGTAEILLSTCGSGEIIGEMALIEHMPRSATARALKPTVLRRLPQAEFDQLLASADPALGTLLTRMAHIIRTLTDTIVRQTLGVR
mgnify:FL=1